MAGQPEDFLNIVVLEKCQLKLQLGGYVMGFNQKLVVKAIEQKLLTDKSKDFYLNLLIYLGIMFFAAGFDRFDTQDPTVGRIAYIGFVLSHLALFVITDIFLTEKE